MAKVFRFHEGDNSLEDWQVSAEYGKNAIEAIQDPAGASAAKEITSIPSPFARIDLVKTAFEYISHNNELDGNTIYHKMVSDALDVGELFFNIDKFTSQVEIITWDKAKDLDRLLNSENAKHRLLGETIKLYLQQDAKANNFSELDRLYLLNYKIGPNALNIIGGTSPISLFFTTANRLDYVDIQFASDRVFDNCYQSLYKRDFAFQKFLFALKKSIPNFSSKFKGVNDYLELCFQRLTAEQKQLINTLNHNVLQNDFDLLLAGNDGNIVEVLGHPLYKKKADQTEIENQSGFVIETTKISKLKPLVLPADIFSDPIIYTTDNWDRNYVMPYFDELPINDRLLPYVQDKYPYLNISDFLEPILIRTIYPIHKEKFFDGNFIAASNDNNRGYLLPLKKEYFDYFDLADLQKTTYDGKKMFEIKQSNTEAVVVTLRVPIKNNKYITYERLYYPPINDFQTPEIQLDRNKGAIIEHEFGLSVYPLIKYENTQSHFRIGLIDRDIAPHTKFRNYTLDFYKETDNSKIKEKAVKQRSDKNNNDLLSSKYYILEGDFDYIELKTGLATALVIPLFTVQNSGTKSYTFAIDFGTTNTHVEYCVDGLEPKPLEIQDHDIQIGTLHNPNNPEISSNPTGINLILETLKHQFIPDQINKKVESHFPQRTAISSKQNLNNKQATYALADYNIPFVYEKYVTPTNSKIQTNLKWSDYANDDKTISHFLENILFLIRNKVVLNGGNLNKTKMKWLYPSSMSMGRINEFGRIWDDLFKKHINTTNQPEKISESIAPFYYYHKLLAVNASSQSAISIDIGGGTSDIIVYVNNEPKILTSLKFAANSIFGDTYGRSSKINGFVLRNLDKVKDLLKENAQYDLIRILENLESTGKSEDLITFFFSIENNKNIIKKNAPISFTSILRNDTDFKIIFIIFYGSLIYHIAKLMLQEGVAHPKYITFSGTGSKIINLIDSNQRLDILAEFTTAIFETVYKYSMNEISLKQDANPKEISAKGALLIDDYQNINVNKIKKVYVGTKQEYRDHSKEITYQEITETVEQSAIDEYYEFLELFFGLNKKLSFKEYFDINPAQLEFYKDCLKENALDDLKQGISEKIKELNGEIDSPINETLFIYPLIGGLHHLAYKIQTQNQ